MAFRLQFFGAAGTVTGSKYLLTFNNKKILVDCGLFQGLKNLRLKNWDRFPVDAVGIDAIVLTHAHIDHSGYIPRLIKEGFKGKVYCTHATKDLCRILLPDSGHLMEEEAQFLNRHRRSKHAPALPLFTEAQARDSLRHFEAVDFMEYKNLASELSFQFRYVGHILGASSVVVNLAGRKIAFTGDIGRMQDRIFFPPENLPPVDYLVTESTYGNRLHKRVDTLEDLEAAINRAYKTKGVILIPAFAVGRTQSLMYDLSILKKQKRLPDVPIYLNSPMATEASGIFCEYKNLHKLTLDECNETSDVVRYVTSVEESKKLNERQGPMIIISASGMMTGGRILHHLKTFAGDHKNTILLTGFQSAGTRGEALLNGAEAIKIHGEYIEVKAEVRLLDNLSAHADYSEIIEWFKKSNIHPKKVFVTHGEVSAADELRRRLTESFHWNCVVPVQDEMVELS